MNEELRRLLESLEFPPPTPDARKAGALYREAFGYIEVGEFDRAEELIDAINKMDFKLKVVFISELLLGIATKRAKGKQIVLALEVAERIELNNHRASAKYQIAVICAELGDKKKALALANGIDNEHYREVALTEINSLGESE